MTSKMQMYRLFSLVKGFWSFSLVRFGIYRKRREATISTTDIRNCSRFSFKGRRYNNCFNRKGQFANQFYTQFSAKTTINTLFRLDPKHIQSIPVCLRNLICRQLFLTNLCILFFPNEFLTVQYFEHN